MDQNNQFVNPNEQPVAPVEPVAPVQPVYAEPVQPVYAQHVQPVYTEPVQPVYAQPVYAQPVQPVGPTVEEVVHDLADKAFGKALAAAIMSSFPITSIIAIVMGSGALKLINQARDIATPYGVKGGAKYFVARGLGLYGKFTGILMTVVWALYFLIIVGIIGAGAW